MTKWLADPEDHDFDAARDYLSLLGMPGQQIADVFRKAETLDGYKAKDILRASGLPVLDDDNKHVKKDLNKIDDGEPLSPVLLVSGQPLIIADGYHRVCAVYWDDEDAVIPCRMVDMK